MRATLEQLKAMSDEELCKAWDDGVFPFDFAACGYCATQHGSMDCSDRGHKKLRAAVIPIWENISSYQRGLKRVLEELYALRLFYDALYPQAVEAAEEKTIAELAPPLVTQG